MKTSWTSLSKTFVPTLGTLNIIVTNVHWLYAVVKINNGVQKCCGGWILCAEQMVQL